MRADVDSPLMSYDSVTSDEDRLAKSKNFTMFYKDLEAGTLPQWMFITPNMSRPYNHIRFHMLTITANDGHDSSVIVAGNWAKGFLEPLLSNPTFMQNTLIMLSMFPTLRSVRLD
jgi:hypothetical protein